MINVMQASMLRDAVWEKEMYDGRQKAMAEIERSMGDVVVTEQSAPGKPSATSKPGQVGIVYDENGRPRPAPMEYDDRYSDAPPDDEDDSTGLADDLPFPGLDPPLG